MARRVPEQNQAQNTPQAQPSAEGIPGGSAGIIPDAASDIPDPTRAVAYAEIPEGEQARAKEYRVENEPPLGKVGYPVLLDGCLSHLPKGKLVSENAYDIQKLKDQGVILREV